MFYHIIKVSYLVVFYFLLSTFTSAQDNWTWLNPKPMGSSIEASGYFPGTNIVIAVGTNGLIMRSTDNGSNWSQIQSNLTSGFYTVSIVNATVAYIAGDGATILKTSDAGQSWAAVTTSDISGTIPQLQFVSATVGYLRLGNVIYKSENSGVNWTSIVTNEDGTITTFYAISETKLFFGTSSGAVYSASLSGIWLTSFLFTFSSESNPPSVKIIVSNGNKIAIFSDYEQLIFSTNAGVDWTPVLRPLSALSYSCAAYTSGDNLVAVTSDEKITTSTNGGNDWSAPSASGSAITTSISANLTGNSIILGGAGLQYNSKDAGVSWAKTCSTITTNQLNSIYSVGGATIWAAGNSRTVVKSTDGGQSWALKITSSSETVNDIKFVDANTGYFVAANKIYRSLDAGESWTVLRIFSSTLNEIAVSDAQNIMIAAGGKKVYFTANAGSSWDSTTLGSSGDHYSVYYLNSTTAFVGGTTGKIYKTEDNGKTWSVGASVTGNLNSIYFSSSTTGWAVGYKPMIGSPGVLLSTTDGGTSWGVVSDTYSSILQSVRFSDSQNGIIVGNLGFVLKTTDGGTTWSRTSQVTDNHLMSAILLDGSTTLVVGVNGTIIKSSNAPLPVELTTFTAAHKNGIVTLNWETKTEIDNYGFEIERRYSATGWQKIGFVEGHFTTNSPKYYNYTDRPNGTGKLQYRLKQIDNDGSFEYSPVVEVDLSGMLPREIEIKNFPNPFSTGSPSGNPETNINILIPETADATVDVYNSTGEKVATLFAGKLYSGETRAFKFDGTRFPSGVYIINVTAGKHRKSHKVMLMK